MEEKKDMRQAMIFLQKYGIIHGAGGKDLSALRSSVYRVLEENPYQLADHVTGVGFKTADEIAARVGIHTDSDYRHPQRHFLYAAAELWGRAMSICRQEDLLAQGGEPSGSADTNVSEKYLMDLAMEKKVVMKEGDGRDTGLCRPTIIIWN